MNNHIIMPVFRRTAYVLRRNAGINPCIGGIRIFGPSVGRSCAPQVAGLQFVGYPVTYTKEPPQEKQAALHSSFPYPVAAWNVWVVGIKLS
jgi:hypothetical protein